MRIAQIAPLYEAVPPKGYGGTERIVSWLTEGLVGNGHEVTLFASGDSETKATLVPCSKKSLRLNDPAADSLICHYLQIEKVADLSEQFDILHFHNDFLHYPVSRRSNYSHLTTLHGRLDIPALGQLYKNFKEVPLVSISNHQRQPLKHANWVKTIYHGLPLEKYEPNFSDGKYFAFLGRISVEKRIDRAIEIAKQTGIKLKAAAKIDIHDKEYYESVKHLLNEPIVEFIGEINEEQKKEFLQNAIALLFPIDWPEPFGLVMIEAMAFGTPVIAFRQGAVPEVIDEGITGNIVSTLDDAVTAAKKIQSLNRKECRKKCEERFDARIMVKNYEEAYECIATKKQKRKFFFKRDLKIRKIRTNTY